MSLTKKHDLLARKFLSDLTIAKEFLAIHLPEEIKDKCIFDTLTIEAGSYIDDDLKETVSDIVYKVNLKDDAGSAYIYTLIEHQSTPVKFMPIRIIRYQLEIIQTHLDKYGEAELLPLVIPLVFYNGIRSPYPYKSDVAELFAESDLYRRFPLGNFGLVDLTIMPEDEILQHGKLAVLEMLAKHIHDRDFKIAISHIVAAIKVGHDLHINMGLINGAFNYLVSAREIEEIQQLIVQIEQNVPDYTEGFMTAAETWKKEGEQRGIQLGKQEAQLEIAKNFLRAGIDSKIVANSTHLSTEQIAELKKSL